MLDRAYVDKVIPSLGLVVTLYDVVAIGPGLVHPSDGGAHHTVTFRVVVFRPFPGETLLGRVLAQDEHEGVRVSLGFFDDLIIPPHGFAENTAWDPTEKVRVATGSMDA